MTNVHCVSKKTRHSTFGKCMSIFKMLSPTDSQYVCYRDNYVDKLPSNIRKFKIGARLLLLPSKVI